LRARIFRAKDGGVAIIVNDVLMKHTLVMAGLVPAIHVFRRFNKTRKEDVDARHKAGHDESIL
jgi:hypothetical protein